MVLVTSLFRYDYDLDAWRRGSAISKREFELLDAQVRGRGGDGCAGLGVEQGLGGGVGIFWAMGPNLELFGGCWGWSPD